MQPVWGQVGDDYLRMPDGQGIVYLSLTEPALRFLRVSPMGGTSQTLHEGTEFESNRRGSWQIYGWQTETGEICPVTAIGGKNPQESFDGQWLLFASGAGQGIWRCRKTDCLLGKIQTAANSVVAELLVPEVQEEDAYNWVPARDGVYFIRRPDNNYSPLVALFRYADGNTQVISTLPKDFCGWGMTLAPDESRLYLTEMTQPGSDI